MMEQLSLWNDAQEELPPGHIRVPNIGETMEVEERWADFDCSPSALEKLARVLLGSLEFRRATNRQWIWFRTIATRIEGNHVVATLQRIEPLLRSYADHQQGCKEEDEEE